MEVDGAELIPADGDALLRVGCAPWERSCCFLLSWKFQLCSEADAGGRGHSLWQSLDLLWRKSLHPKELEDGVCYFRAAQGEALQSSTLLFCHLHSWFVWEVLLCSECKQKSCPAGMVPCSLWMLQQDVVPRDVLCRWLWSRVQPTMCHMEPTRRMQEEEKTIRGKCQASAFCWPAGSCVARELFLAELAQRLCLPPLANFHKLLWNTGGSLELSDRVSELCTAALW